MLTCVVILKCNYLVFVYLLHLCDQKKKLSDKELGEWLSKLVDKGSSSIAGVFVCMRERKNACVICIFVCIHVCIFVYTCIYIHISICMYMNIYIHIYEYLYYENISMNIYL